MTVEGYAVSTGFKYRICPTNPCAVERWDARRRRWVTAFATDFESPDAARAWIIAIYRHLDLDAPCVSRRGVEGIKGQSK